MTPAIPARNSTVDETGETHLGSHRKDFPAPFLGAGVTRNYETVTGPVLRMYSEYG